MRPTSKPTREGTHGNDRPLGTASWTHPADVVAQHRYTNGALWLGRSPTDEATPIGFGDDRHVLLTSGNRGGKGTTFIVPNLVLWPVGGGCGPEGRECDPHGGAARTGVRVLRRHGPASPCPRSIRRRQQCPRNSEADSIRSMPSIPLIPKLSIEPP